MSRKSRNRSRPTKTKADLIAHFRARLRERYNMVVSGEEVERVIGRIQGGQTRPLGAISRRVTNHAVLVSGTDLESLDVEERLVAVGYDKQRGCLVTALPPRYLPAEAAGPADDGAAPADGAASSSGEENGEKLDQGQPPGSPKGGEQAPSPAP